MQNHDNIEALASEYLLGMLGPEEREAFEEHLATCPSCARELAEMQHATNLLALSVEEREPPPYLKERIMAAISTEGDAAPDISHEPSSGPWWSILTRPLVAAPVLVVMLVAIFGLGYWNFNAQDELERSQRRIDRSYQAIEIMAQAEQWWRIDTARSAPETTGVMAHSSEHGAACIVLFDLPTLKEGQRFYAWSSRDGVTTSIGNMWSLGDSQWRLIPGEDVGNLSEVTITLEDSLSATEPRGPVIATINIGQ